MLKSILLSVGAILITSILNSFLVLDVLHLTMHNPFYWVEIVVFGAVNGIVISHLVLKLRLDRITRDY